jgi:predicted Zn finger-like uncharacterized protein
VQTNCPNCSNRLVVDDAKVPATPFMLKCPKCQNMVKVPGRSAQPAAAPPTPTPPAPSIPFEARPAPPLSPAPAPAPAAPPPATAPPNVAPPSFAIAAPASAAPPIRTPSPSGAAAKALVAVPAADVALSVASVLGRLGFAVEQLDSVDEKMIRLQQGDFSVVVSTRNGVPEDRDVYRLVQTMPLEVRRRMFLVLLGDDLQTGEGSQAFALLADLVIQSKDAPSCDRLLVQTLMERKRVYQTFWDAEDRKLEGKL